MLRYSVVLLLCALIFGPHHLYSQCITAPPADACTGTEPALTDYSVLSAGIKRWYYAAPAVFNQLTIQGGKLIVCGDLTIDRLRMDSGTIVVRPGAKLLIRGGMSGSLIFEGNTAVYNYGTMQITCNLTLNGTYASAARPNIVVNATPSAFFSLASQYFVINNPYSFFVNKGVSEFHGIITDNGSIAGSVCLGNGSATNMTVLINKIKKSYVVPSGAACVQVRQFSQFYDTLTASPGLNICLGAGHSSDASCTPFGCKPNAWGTAQLFTNCNSCADITLLPFRFVSFGVQSNPTGNLLQWNVATQDPDVHFIAERSANGTHFSTVCEKQLQPAVSNYTCTDLPVAETIYYRIRGINQATGAVYTSNIVKVQQPVTKNAVVITPNPFQHTVRISWQIGYRPVSMFMMDATGNKVYTTKTTPGNDAGMVLQLPEGLPVGNYWLKLVYQDGTSVVKRIVKL